MQHDEQKQRLGSINRAYKMEESYLVICDDNYLFLTLLMQMAAGKDGNPTASVLLMRTNSGPGLRALARTGKTAIAVAKRELNVFMMSK